MKLDSQTAALLRSLNAQGGGTVQDMRQVDIETARQGSRALWQAYQGPLADSVSVKALSIPGPAGSIPARLYRPAEATEDEKLPAVVFFHGGGWCMGDLDSYEGLMRDLCRQSGALFLSVDYRLAPEHKYPAGQQDGLMATRWAFSHIPAMGGDVHRLAVMGDSAGANLATVICHGFHRGGEQRLAAQFLIYPVLDVTRPHSTYPSRMAFGGGDYLLSRDSIDVTTDWYLEDGAAADDPSVSPIDLTDLQVLPPTLILAAEFDPLRDEAKAFRDKLAAAGVAVEWRCFEGAIHAFLSFATLDIAQAGRAYLAEQVRRLLSAPSDCDP